ncbi:oxidoreductase, partial [Aspergillus sclerotialis]
MPASYQIAAAQLELYHFLQIASTAKSILYNFIVQDCAEAMMLRTRLFSSRNPLRSLHRCFSSTRAQRADVTHAVIGAGVVGLAIARQLASREGTSTILLERHDAPGTETSSRNSEVIHAGLYYGADSLKTHLCISGREKLYDLCSKHSIPHLNTKKWIVAQTPEQWGATLKVHEHARSLGIPTRLVGSEEAQRREPEVQALAGILESESTGIVDSHSLMLHLQGEFEDKGGDAAFLTSVTGIEKVEDGYRITATSGDGSGEGETTSITAETVINSGGNFAFHLNNMLLPPERHRIPLYAKGTYFSYSASHPKTSVLVYPATLPGHGGLGTHLTLDLGGRIRFGPDVEWIDDPYDLKPSPARLKEAIPEIKAYLPNVNPEAIDLDYCGIRPKLGRGGVLNTGKGFQDFYIKEEEGFPGFVNLLGIE